MRRAAETQDLETSTLVLNHACYYVLSSIQSSLALAELTGMQA